MVISFMNKEIQNRVTYIGNYFPKQRNLDSGKAHQSITDGLAQKMSKRRCLEYTLQNASQISEKCTFQSTTRTK